MIGGGSGTTTTTTSDTSPPSSKIPNWVWRGLPNLYPGFNGKMTDEESSRLGKLIQVIDGFLLSSGIGQFEQRLSMVKAFGAELLYASYRVVGGDKKEGGKITMLEQCARMFTSLHSYYSQFLGIVGRYWERLKADIAKKLKDEVKLTKWDEQNYYALTESIEKNHRKLNKFLREYDEVLGVNVSVIIEKDVTKGVREVSENSGGIGPGGTGVKACFEIPS